MRHGNRGHCRLSYERLLVLAVLTAIPFACMAQVSDTLGWNGKLRFHAESTYSPMAIMGFSAYAGVLQKLDTPAEWGQGGAAYAKRVASTAAWSGAQRQLRRGWCH
jgi:hypothetical protein